MILNKKTGFEVIRGPIIIDDKRGVEFYNSSFLTNPVKKFNLPKGEYTIRSGIFVPLNKPVNFPLHPIPKSQRTYPSPRNFKIVFGDNPNKCSVFWDRELIIFDKSFKSAPKYVVDFILFHEFGHQYYDTELFADLYAGNMMKVKGYNPSQIGMSPIVSLSSFQDMRKQKMVETLIRYKK